MLRTVNNIVACKPLDAKAMEKPNGISLNSDKKMFELEVMYPDEKSDFSPGDLIYLDRSFEFLDSASFLRTPVKIGEVSCVLVPREYIRAHKNGMNVPNVSTTAFR